MSRWFIGVGIIGLSVALPLSAAQKQTEKDAPKPAAHVVLHDELLQEQQYLQRLQTEWLLQLLKTKQRLDKAGDETAKQEAAVCAKLLESARELPGLYDTAAMRLKDASLANLPATEKTLKATKRLTDELRRASDTLRQATPAAFKAERAVDEKVSESLFALIETAEWNAALHALDAVEQSGDFTPVMKVRELVRDRIEMWQWLREQCRGLSDEAKTIPMDALLAHLGPFERVRSSLALVDQPSRIDANGATQLRKDMRVFLAAFEPLRDASARLMVVGGLRQLADRQQRLHDRLQKQRDDVVSRLLEEIE